MISELEKVKRWVYGCIKCNTCKTLAEAGEYQRSCPSGEKYFFETYFSSGRVAIARALLEGKIEFTDSVLKKIYACPTCGNCVEICTMEVSEHLVEIIEAVRAAAVAAGAGPLDAHKTFAISIRTYHNPYGESPDRRTEWVPIADFDKQAEICYFVGCTASYRRQEIARATYDLFQKLGLKIAISPEEWCCGSPLLRTGQLELVKELIEHNIQVLRDMGVKKVITACAGCYRTMLIDWPKIIQDDLGFEIQHVTDFLLEQVEAGKLAFNKETKETVTYHDPCHLGRHSKVFESPRKLILSIPGVELNEMPRNREMAWCCGAGGGVKSGFKEWAVEISKERIEEAEKTGATKLITSCPFCVTNLGDAIKESGSNLKLYDITQYLLEKL
ncbi:MAG: (Fe-S)-binding protein [Candidatus Helarchaeota archaeon]